MIATHVQYFYTNLLSSDRIPRDLSLVAEIIPQMVTDVHNAMLTRLPLDTKIMVRSV